MDEQVGNDAVADMSRDYLRHAQQQSMRARLDAFMRDTQPEAAPAEKSEAVGLPVTQEPSRAPVQITVRPKSGMERVVDTAWSLSGDAAAGVWAAGKDIAGGLALEGGPAIAGGVSDAVRNAVRALDGVGTWLNENVADLTVAIPSTGNETADALLANPLKALKPGTMPKPSTVTGNVIREGARFLTGFVPAVRALRGAGAGDFAAIAGAGAISDAVTQDPSEAGLANLVEAAPALRNPVTRLLATDPDDPEALNRLRHAAEGVGLGALTEGVIRGIRAVASARKAIPEIEAQKLLHGSLETSRPVMGGDAQAPLVSVRDKLASSAAATQTGVPDAVAARGIAGSADEHASQAGLARVLKADDAPVSRSVAVDEGPDVFVNFGRMNNADDVNQVIRDLADAFKGDINAARRGVQTNEQTRALADQVGMTAEELLARQKGQPFNAEQALAARRLLNTSAERLLEMARLAANPEAQLSDHYNFRRMLATHHAIQSEVIAARTETARALQSWSIPAGSGNVEAVRAIEQMLETSGGRDVSADLARRMATLAAQGVPAGALANMVRRGWAATSLSMVQESYVLGLLWNPSTHLVNTGSNLIVAFQQVYERAAARGIGDMLGSAVDARVVDGEALAMTYGMVSSLKDALRLSGQALMSGQTGAALAKTEIKRVGAISSETIARERGLGVIEAQAFAETPMGRAIDFAGATTRVPGNLLAAGDEFFKTVTYRAEAHAQALRQASQEGLSGPDRFRRMMEIVNDPPEHIRIAAADAALYATFQNKTGNIGQGLLRLRNSGSLNPLFMVLPFVKTPTNILRYTFERSPLAPLVGQWRDDIAAGGARRDLALARMATGTAIMSVALDYASSGVITGAGPRDPGKREALMRGGWQPNSVVIGDKYYSFNRADPLGTLLGFAGTLAEMMKEKDAAAEDFDELEDILATGLAAVSASVVNKTYFQGVANLVTAIERAPTSDAAAKRLVGQWAAPLVPFSSALNTVRRGLDPASRDINSVWDEIAARLPALSETLPPARDVWGEERRPQEVYGRLYDVLSPVAARERVDSPIDEEIAGLRMSVQRIQKKTVFAGADVDFRDFPHVYDEYVRLAGNDLKHPAWGIGARDMLDAVVTGKHPLSAMYRMFSDGPEGKRAAFIKETVAGYRQLAQQRIMAEPDRWPDFVTHVRERSRERKRRRFPLDPALFGGAIPGMQ